MRLRAPRKKHARRKREKGQVFEILSFTILAVTIIGIIIFMRVFLVGGAGRSLVSIRDRHEREGFNTGMNSVLYTTEDKTGKTLLELIGLAAYKGEYEINLGPGVGNISVIDELTWRFNALYGKGKWYFKAEIPYIENDIQMVIVLDASASLCDDIEQIKNDLPIILEELRNQGKKVSAYLYMLPGGAECCGGLKLTCSEFTETKYFHCRNLESQDCQLGGSTEEDWGNGLVCALKEGQKEWWSELSVKVGVILSDELPGGSEGCQPMSNTNSFQYNSLQKAIQKANENKIKVFPIKARTCGPVCFKENGMEMWACLTSSCPGTIANDCPATHSYQQCIMDQCACSPTLDNYMNKIAADTKGSKIEIKDSSEVVKKIKEIMDSLKPPKLPQIEAGSKSGYEQRVSQIKSGEKPFLNSFDVTIPVSLTGEYTEAHVYRWT